MVLAVSRRLTQVSLAAVVESTTRPTETQTKRAAITPASTASTTRRANVRLPRTPPVCFLAATTRLVRDIEFTPDLPPGYDEPVLVPHTPSPLPAVANMPSTWSMRLFILVISAFMVATFRFAVAISDSARFNQVVAVP